MSLRSSSYVCAASILGLMHAGCPGPEPSLTEDGTGGASVASTGVGPGPGPASSGATSSTTSGASSSKGAGGGGGEGGDGEGAGGHGGRAEGGGGEGGAGGRPGTGGAGGTGGECPTDTVESCGECDRQCKETNVVEPSCDGVACDSLCEDGWLNRNRPSVGDDDGCETRILRVFVTSAAVPLPFEGAAGADDICNEEAAELAPGVWRAWISDEQDSPASRFEVADEELVQFVLLNGQVVANGWSDLTDATIGAAINRTELLTELAETERVWTSTRFDGTVRAGSHCDSWSFSDGGLVAGVGDPNAVAERWTDAPATVPCGDGEESNAHHLYCFEMPQ